MGRAERRRLEKEKNQKPVYYQYTPQQIEEIRRRAVRDRKDELDAYVKKIVEHEWEERAKVLKGETTEETMQIVLCLLMAVPTRILCENFGWKPITDESDNRSRLKRFTEMVVSEVNRICEDDTVDIRTYGEEVFEKFGVRYEIQ